jgi:hypothetical protein
MTFVNAACITILTFLGGHFVIVLPDNIGAVDLVHWPRLYQGIWIYGIATPAILSWVALLIGICTVRHG